MAAYASAQGNEVISLCRSGAVPSWNGTCIKWSLGQGVPQTALAAVDCAIHLAHDFNGVQGAELTIDSTLAAITQLREAGARRQLFFSSYSAGEHATSLYGKTKLAIENALSGQQDVAIVRPGLVLGKGGIYGRIQEWARILPVIPLPDGGRGTVPVITIERLCHEVVNLAHATLPVDEANLFETCPRSLRQLVIDAAGDVGRPPWIVPVPSSLIGWGLQVAQILRIPLPINADNLEGFLANQNACHVSTLKDSRT
ncbi:MAG: hypothetical protein ACOZB0_03365 [Pseudomonadota bacterium]